MYISFYTLLISIVGTIATFLPWVYYPKGDTNLYGYVGDGIVTGFVFLIIGIFSIVEIVKQKNITSLKIINALLSLWMMILAISNIMEIEKEKTNFETDNPFIGAAFAGFTQGSGLYVLGLSGLGVLIFSLIGLYIGDKNSEATYDKKLKIYLPVSILLVLLIAFLVNRQGLSFKSAPNEEQMHDIFQRDVEKMGACLINRDYECFVNYNHPMIVQSYGSKEKMKELVNGAMHTYRDMGGEYKKIKFVDIQQIEHKGQNIQAIINQDVTILKNNEDVVERQRLLGVSVDIGATWYYINLNGMTKEKISDFYPAFNPNLNF